MYKYGGWSLVWQLPNKLNTFWPMNTYSSPLPFTTSHLPLILQFLQSDLCRQIPRSPDDRSSGSWLAVGLLSEQMITGARPGTLPWKKNNLHLTTVFADFLLWICEHRDLQISCWFLLWIWNPCRVWFYFCLDTYLLSR